MGHLPAIPASSNGTAQPICQVVGGSSFCESKTVGITGGDNRSAFTVPIAATPALFRRLSSPVIARALGDCRLNCKERRGKKENEERHKHLRRRRKPSAVGPPPSIHPFIQVVNGTGFHPATAACIGASRHLVQTHVKSLNHYKDVLS